MLKAVKVELTDDVEYQCWEGTQLDLLRMVGSLDEQQRQRKTDGSELDEIRERVALVEQQRSESNKELLRTQAERQQIIRELTRQIEES
ncbi:hypothetical protein ACJZRZ_003917 [Vibrio parahaemolyticus]|uniref:hypothetical protein n=1 Tax=Vibrio harveyi group TaxID=717610 RepID=UPI0006A5B004|nr:MULTISPECIES: hypothetical protein [Vibrio harveyi group]AYO10844.1 hypothetical protein D0784_16600 [Vibrio campbellii]EGQ7678500.1 hypothetical protein [Vibrio parahaemolyticus]EGQ9298334.1 hypothetical protein [Vibrio parahaemolyticus]EHE7897404.1 hypothetical protein [Vibrio parahaemolyticus]EHK2924396.1 hypothetical protein [Vibrio parahaemolyticus]